MTDRRYHHHL